MGRVADLRRERSAAGGGAATRGRAADGLDPRLQRLLDLQREAGNAAVVQLVREDGSDEGAAASEGDEPAAPSEESEDPAAVEKAKALFESGARAYDGGAYAKAYDEFSRAYELVPRPSLQFSMAQALRRLGGRREEALDLYQAYLDSGETKRADDCTKAIAELSTPASSGDLEADTKVGKAIFEKGARLYAGHDFAHAYDEFARAYELTGRTALLFSQAQSLRRLGGRREEAIELYEAYLAKGDGGRQGDARAALKELQTPASSGDLDADMATGRGIFNRGAAAYERGDFGHAYDEFTRSYELTGRPALLFSRAQALRRLGARREEAVSLYQEYLEQGDGNRATEARRFIEELSAPAVE